MTADHDNYRARICDTRVLRRYLGFLRPHGRLMACAFAALLAQMGLELTGPLVIRAAIDGPVAAKDAAGVLPYALALLGVLLGAGVFKYAQIVATNQIGQRVLHDLRQSVFGHLQRLPMAFFDRKPVGDLVTLIASDVEALKELFIAGLMTIVGDLAALVGIVAVLVLLDARLATFVFLVVPFVAVITIVFRSFARRYHREIRACLARLSAYLFENLTGMRIVQLFNREAVNRARFERLNSDHQAACLRSIRAYALFLPSIHALALLSFALLLWGGGERILEGTLTCGTFIAFWAYTQKFFSPLLDLAEKDSVLQAAMAASERIFDLLDTPVAIAAGPAQERPSVPLRGEIEFRGVTFAYSDGHNVLDDVSFHIRPGESVAIVGATGGGKTTIASLLSRLYEVERGTILLDGKDIRTYDVAWLRRQVAVAVQDVFCFTGTVASNIRLGEASIASGRMEAAARLAHAEGFVRRLPGGLDAEVRERGAGFSAGEKQLLGLARALAVDPRILVLDEATSGVDAEADGLIQDTLRNSFDGRTLLIIAHRLSTIRHCGRILVLHRGKFREEGSHDDLIRLGGIYARLYALQTRNGEKCTLP